MSKYLILGGTGSLGKKLIDRLLNDEEFHSSNEVCVYSRDEAKHWTILNELSSSPKFKESLRRLKFFVGDIRDATRTKDVISLVRPDTIIIAAALKQVDTCERSPSESVATNLIGTQNVVDAINFISSHSDYVKRVLFVSTDKACAPVNVYGMCKAISERLITSQSEWSQGVRFLAVRYGNVLESRGSIIPLFKYQAENAEHLTVTHPDMTRFVMTLDDSVDLILDTLKYARSGQIFIPKLPAMRIGDLAEIFATLHNKQIKITGLRPGEKMHEELVNESESIRTRVHKFDLRNGSIHLKSDPYEIDPAHSTSYMAGHLVKPFRYTSADDVMSKEKLFEHLTSLSIVNRPLSEFEGLRIEEINTNKK